MSRKLIMVWVRIVRMSNGEIAPPNGCELCGWLEREHFQFYFGLHAAPDSPKGYLAPEDATRLARMKLRRRERLLARRSARA